MNGQTKKLFVISGSSGVGKGTVISRLLSERDDIKLSVSCTTRPPRAGEVDGREYFFVSFDEFDNFIKNDEFIEWAEFSNNRYGTKKSFVEETLKNGDNVLLEIDTQGALQIKSKMPESVLIFIAPPSYEELVSRLRGRHTESEDSIKTRLDFVEFERKNSAKFDYIIVNDTVENAVNRINQIIGK